MKSMVFKIALSLGLAATAADASASSNEIQFYDGIRVYCSDANQIAFAQKVLTQFRAKERASTGTRPNAKGEYILRGQVNPSGGPKTSFTMQEHAELFPGNPMRVYVSLSSEWREDMGIYIIFNSSCSAEGTSLF